MNKQTKVLIFGGIGLAILTFFAFKLFAKDKKVAPRPNTSDTDVEDDDYPEQVMSVVTRSGSRLRAEPSTDSDILKTFSAGNTLFVVDNIIKDDGLWYMVDDGEFLSGWMRSDVVDDLQVVRNY